MASSSTDPAAIWRNMVAEWEKNLNALGKQATSTPAFSQAMNQATGLSLAVQQGLGEVVGRYIGALNLASREDVASLGERLLAIEERLDRLTRLLESGSAAASPAFPPKPRPPRTRRPPGNTAAPGAPGEGGKS